MAIRKGEVRLGPVVMHVYNGGFAKDRDNKPRNIKSRVYREVPVVTFKQDWLDDDIIGRRRMKALKKELLNGQN